MSKQGNFSLSLFADTCYPYFMIYKASYSISHLIYQNLRLSPATYSQKIREDFFCCCNDADAKKMKTISIEIVQSQFLVFIHASPYFFLSIFLWH